MRAGRELGGEVVVQARDGRRILRRLRTTLFDAKGRATSVFESDIESGGTTHVSASMIGTMGARALAILPALARLVEPDALYAQSTTDVVAADGTAKCSTELAFMTAAVGLAAAADIEYAGARLALTAAEAAMAAVCVEAAPVCAELFPALAAAITAAEVAVAAKGVRAAALTVSAGIASAAYFNCLRTATDTTTTSGGGTDLGSAAPLPPPTHTPCYVLITWDNAGNVISVSDPYACLG